MPRPHAFPAEEERPDPLVTDPASAKYPSFHAVESIKNRVAVLLGCEEDAHSLAAEVNALKVSMCLFLRYTGVFFVEM